jgi:hypothetical protein
MATKKRRVAETEEEEEQRPASRTTRSSVREGMQGSKKSPAKTRDSAHQEAVSLPPRKPAPPLPAQRASSGRAKNASAGETPHPGRKSAGRVEVLEEEDSEEEEGDEEGEEEGSEHTDGSSEEEEGEEKANDQMASKRSPAHVEREEEVAGSDSDDDAPEEVSASEAKGQLQRAQRAEAESRRALAEQKKTANKQRELQILLAKQEQERAQEKEARRKEKAAKQQARQAKLEALSSDVLAALVEKDEQKQQQEDLLMAKKAKKAKCVPLGDGPSVVHKNGFTIQKLESQVVKIRIRHGVF